MSNGTINGTAFRIGLRMVNGTISLEDGRGVKKLIGACCTAGLVHSVAPITYGPNKFVPKPGCRGPTTEHCFITVESKDLDTDRLSHDGFDLLSKTECMLHRQYDRSVSIMLEVDDLNHETIPDCTTTIFIQFFSLL